MMDALADWTLTILAMYGVPILFLSSYVGSLGIPFPNSLVIIAAGAFAREGIIDWRLAIFACLVGSTLADNSEYLLGYWAHAWLKRRFGQQPVWQQALATVDRRGGWAILLTRFWLMPLAPAVNMIAGSRYPYERFLFLDIVGQLVWVLLYGGLGYFFAGQWKLVSRAASDFSGLSFGLLILGVGVYGLIVWVRNRKFGRTRRIHKRCG
jgi:membrane-associated protein